MDNYRFLNCGKSITNYYLCLDEKVAGFTQRAAFEGDIVYFTVKVDKNTLCGARGILEELTDYKPWEDADRYVQVFKVSNITYCVPFELKVIKEVCGTYWGKYLQSPKAIKEMEAINLLDDKIQQNRIDDYFKFGILETTDEQTEKQETLIPENNEEEFETTNTDTDEKLDIMGTFQTIKFKNETDPIMGLEPLVTEYFYKLFTHFKEENTVLISDNRLFSTSTFKNENNETIPGIKSIPDALLISYDKDSKNTPIKINLIEYECYGENKLRTTQKFNYLNGTVIPQLIRFASNFSIVTDEKIRKNTINEWVDKIMDYIDEDEYVTSKIKTWVQELHPNVKERQIDRIFDNELRDAFESNIRIILVIDELTIEQKETIKNVINSFKLNNSNSKIKDNYIEFSAYVIRLEQKIGIVNKEASFALSFQD